MRAQERSSTPPKTIQLDAATLQSYVGQYLPDDDPDSPYSISTDGGHLFMEAPRFPRTELAVEAKDHLLLGTQTRFIMVRDAIGRVTGWSETAQGQESFAKKISDTPMPNHFREYERTEAMVPMRDGVKLHVVILRPKNSETGSKPLPILLERTPYGVSGRNSDGVNARYTELAQSGYIFVFEDIRGRYGSEGQFVMNRPLVHVLGNRSDPKKVDESSDTYDTVEWLLKNMSNNNGRVGAMGISYDGFTAIMAGIDPHPAMKAISPQAPMTDTWLGDDFFHNGAFRQTYGYDYVLGMESSKQNAFGKFNEDAFDYFLKAGNYAEATKKGGMNDLPTAKAFVAHPEYAKFWREMAVEPHLNVVTVPALEVGGWWDQEDMWGPQAEYAALKPHDAKHEVYLVLGPWRHGGWGGTTRVLGAIEFGSATTDYFRKNFEAPFFAHYLKDEPGFDLKDTASFQTGSDVWMRYPQWPPKRGFHTANLYLAANGGLSFNKPAAADKNAFTAYVSDPANPIPYRHRPIQATYAPDSKWYTWLVEDQRFVYNRNDVAHWSTAPLDKDITITGDVMADIFAATTGTDADWVVKLIDVYPDDAPGGMAGYQLMIADEIFRGRYRRSFEKPEAIPANAIEEYKWSLHGADHVFLKGHRIMVEVQSSWFPLYDRNPQTFVKDIMTAPPQAYKQATQSIYWSAQHASHLELPIADVQ